MYPVFILFKEIEQYLLTYVCDIITVWLCIVPTEKLCSCFVLRSLHHHLMLLILQLSFSPRIHYISSLLHLRGSITVSP